MPLYYFVIRCGVHVYPDRTGQTIEEPSELRPAARAYVEALGLNEAVTVLRDPRCRVEILDDRRKIIHDLLVSEL